MKRLAVFCDGTWNDPDSDTNVSRLQAWVAARDRQGVLQKSLYVQGVGLKPFERLLGGTVGKGLSANVLEGYRWLVDNYDDNDEIYLFGFSRGAYTARSIGGAIVRCGLLRRGAGMSVEDLYARYRVGKKARGLYEVENDSREGKTLTPDDARLLTSSRRVPIHMIGVWDTVGALGVPWTHAPIVGRSNFYFHNTNPSVLIKHAYQAVAIDEHRGPYKPTLWTHYAAPGETVSPRELKTITEQRWFIGAHCNVGGGYRNDALRKLPLKWIQSKASDAGLAFTQEILLDGSEGTGAYTDSYKAFMKGVYRWMSTRFLRPIGADARKVKDGGLSTPLEEWIDASVFERCRRDLKYRPANLVKLAKERGFDPLGVRGDLRVSKY